MTDRIEPAWNADMLSWIQNDPGDVRLALDRGMDNIAYYLKGELPNLIALANAALPDTDPRKITWQGTRMLRALRVFIQTGHMPSLDVRADLEDFLATHIAALESYLPPEAP